MGKLASVAFGLLFLAWTSPMSEAASAARSVAPLADRMRDHLAMLSRSEGFSGVVLIAKDGKPVFQQAYGLANVADGVANTTATKFNMASMGKMFTAVAVLQLVEAGKIASLQDKVGKYLPDYPNAAVREQVTIEELLTHTSGMGNFWEQLAGKAKDRYVAIADYVPLFADEKLQFEPGKGFAYSNNGYTVLGLIVEAVSGKSYFDYVRDNIYRPCGMTDTDAYELDKPVAHMATGYSRSPSVPHQLVSNIYVLPYKGSSAGGSYTTASDLLKFANALLSFRLLNRQDTETLTSGKANYGARRYAYGFTEDTANGHRLIGHGGGNAGIADELMMFTDLGYTAVILTNGDVENFWDIRNFTKREIMGPSADTRSFDFTRSLIDVVEHRGYEQSVALLNADPAHPAIRNGLLEQIGYKLLWQGRITQAQEIFRLYALAVPDDAYAYLGLGAADERAGDKAGAIAAYTKYVGMEPDDKDAAARLEKLRKP
ncbi:MAG TPA: serine hydrolase [Rhizomicrobium sp.]|nr:serine hydrolase [Rhizomicrobium sp.]